MVITDPKSATVGAISGECGFLNFVSFVKDRDSKNRIKTYNLVQVKEHFYMFIDRLELLQPAKQNLTKSMVSSCAYSI